MIQRLCGSSGPFHTLPGATLGATSHDKKKFSYYLELPFSFKANSTLYKLTTYLTFGMDRSKIGFIRRPKNCSSGEGAAGILQTSSTIPAVL
jgi:hypothetical protein